MSDIDDELLGLAGEGTDLDAKNRKRKASNGSKSKSKKFKSAAEIVDEDETEDEYPMNLSHGRSAPAADDDEEDDDMDMDLDIESEDGYGERRPLPVEASATATAQGNADVSPGDSEDDGKPSRPAPIKRESSAKKPKPKEKKAPAAKGRATKRKAPVTKTAKPAESQTQNPYPLEGKFKDEVDRDYLLGLPEIQREEIIASRLEEYQKFVDRQQLAALYTKTTGGDALHSDGGEDEEDAEGEQDMELDMDIDEDSEEELGRGATRAKTKSEPKSKALDKLAEKRRARTDRANNRGSGPRPPKRSDDSDAESVRSEGSEYGGRKGPRKLRRRDSEYSDDYSDSDRERNRSRSDTKSKRDDLPATLDAIERVRLSRHDLAEFKHRTFFEAMIKGAYVRCVAGQDERRQPKYRVFQVVGLTGEDRTYNVEDRGKSIPENRRLNLKYGKSTRPYRMAEVSNSVFTESEYRRWKLTMDEDDVNLPFRSDIEAKEAKLKEMREMHVTDEDIAARVKAMQKMGAAASGDKMQEQILLSELGLAQRRNDLDAIQALQAQVSQLQELKVAQEAGNVSKDAMADMLAKVNERSKRVVAESHRRAFKAETEKKRLALENVKSRMSRGLSGSGTPAQNPEVQAHPTAEHNDHAKIIETKTGDLAVDLDLGDF